MSNPLHVSQAASSRQAFSAQPRQAQSWQQALSWPFFSPALTRHSHQPPAAYQRGPQLPAPLRPWQCCCEGPQRSISGPLCDPVPC